MGTGLGALLGKKGFALLVIGFFFYLSSSLFTALAMGAVFAVLLFPWLERLEKRKLATPVAAAIITLGMTVLFLLPMAFLAFLGARAGLEQLQSLRLQTAGGSAWYYPKLYRILYWISETFPIDMKSLIETSHDLARTVGLRVADGLGVFFGHLPGMVLALAMAVVSTYFFLVDGRRLTSFLRRNSVFDPPNTERMIDGVTVMCRSVILAMIVSGLSQSIIYSLACLASKVPNVMVIGMLVFLGSFVPLVGSAPVTFGLALYQFLIDRNTVGITLLVVASIVGILDNLVRPIILQGSGNLHPLLAFIAAFGGLQVFGVSGVFLGPILAGVFVVTVSIVAEDQSV